MLLQIARSTNEPGKLVLNRPPSRPGQDGRRRGLPSSAAEALVRVWIDEAVEQLTRMPYTCVLDLVHDLPLFDHHTALFHGIPVARIAKYFNVTKQAASQLSARALVRLAIGLKPFVEEQRAARALLSEALRD